MTNLNALLEQIYHSTSPEFEPLRSLIQEKALLEDGTFNLKDATSAFLLHEWAELILKECVQSYRLANINYEQFSSLAIPLIQLRAHIDRKITSGSFPTLTLDEVMKIVAINYPFNEVDTLKKDLDIIYLAVSCKTTAEEIRQYVNGTITARAINRTSMQNVSEKMVNLRESFLEIPLVSNCERNVFYSFLLGFIIRKIYPELVKDAREDSVSKIKTLSLVLMFAYQVGSLTFSVDEIENQNVFDKITDSAASIDFYAITVNNAATIEQSSDNENSDVTFDKKSLKFLLVLYAFIFDSKNESIRKRFWLEIPGEIYEFKEKMSPAQRARLKKLSFLLLGGVAAMVLIAIVNHYLPVITSIAFGLGAVAAYLALVSALLAIIVLTVGTVRAFLNDKDSSSIHRLKERIGTWATNFPENTVIAEATSYLGKDPSLAADHSANNLEKWLGNVLIHIEIQAEPMAHTMLDMAETPDGIELAPMPSFSSSDLLPQ